MTEQELRSTLRDELNRHIEQNIKWLEGISVRNAIEFGFDLCFQAMTQIMKENNKNLKS